MNLQEIEKDLAEYRNINEFFTRRVKPRHILPDADTAVSPADSKVLSFQEISGDAVLVVKNITYKLGEFLTGTKGYEITTASFSQMKVHPASAHSKLYSIIFYLSPGDYHHYHSPAHFKIEASTHIPGKLRPVYEKYLLRHKVNFFSSALRCIAGHPP